MNTHPTMRLRDLPLGVRGGLVFTLLAFLGGMIASGIHLKWHHEKRDEQAGLSMVDIRGAYHGVVNRAPLLTALERGHPEAPHSLAQPARDTLLKWLASGRVREDYDNLDLGDLAPAEIIASSCVSCHAPDASDAAGATKESRGVSLKFFDDVMKVAFSREINPTDKKVLAASTHAHALAMATMTIALSGLAALTRWPRGLVGLFCLGMGVGLAGDIACWWISRDYAWAVWGVVGFGTMYNVSTTLTCLAVIADCVRGRR